ncbi:OmpP1/FadL family transporter [Legionella quateirensis]|uniref:Long-chain fatty acid transporter n=1 Tax=Legionella quateirensis TaxID=45072 RepID=A0A378L072_9GAMM|nr:outer membrane protein transport protein [Legionella quateirensis]KTD52821.1 long-chain fatty acid transporter [Legionella quateirensis]STY19241.1 long-chain fatty acid transporter [Legionella quateirensis]
MARSKGIMRYVTLGLLLLSGSLYASFIEQTLGAAVVKDATAVYFNPAALTVIPHQQLILLGTLARAQSQFTGSAQQVPFGITEFGTVTSKSNFSLPSMYVSLPINDQFAAGFAIVANDFDRDLDDHSVLRYVQARNQTKDVDLVPAIGIKINEFLSIGGNLNITHAHLIQEPVSGVTRLNIPDSRSLNNSKANSLGGDLGILIQMSKSTTLGFNYRSAITYHFHGTSTITSPQFISSDDFHFKFWTPARSVLSLSHFLNEKLGFIGTIQYLQWNIFKEAYIYNFATQSGRRAFIVPKARIDYNFYNSWLLTLGTIYNLSSKWKFRVAGTYNQSPSNGRFQIGTGDSLTVGSSVGYQILENLSMDFSYGHAFYQNELINIKTAQNIITGVNHNTHDAVSLKLTLTA